MTQRQQLSSPGKPVKVLILGYGPMGQALTQGVLSCPGIAQLVGVFPWSNKPREEDFAQEQSEQTFCSFLSDHCIPILKAPSVNHFAFVQLLTRIKPHVVLIGSWGEILQPHILNLSDIYFINCHPSLLPYHRGPNPYAAVIRQGEAKTGVTFHLIDQGIDTGPVLIQGSLDIYPEDTGASLRERTAHLAETLVPTLLENLVDGTLTAEPQVGKGSYDPPLLPEAGWIEWDLPPAEIERNIRAITPWYESITLLNSRMVGFSFGHLVQVNGTQARPYLPGTILRVERDRLTTATSDPSWHLILKDPYFMEFPRFLTPLMKNWLIHPGRQFYTPPERRKRH